MPQKSITEIIEIIEECQKESELPIRNATYILDKLLPAVHELALHVQILEQE